MFYTKYVFMKKYINILVWSERRNIAKYYLWLICILGAPLFYEAKHHNTEWHSYVYITVSLILLPLCIFSKKLPHAIPVITAIFLTVFYFIFRTFTQSDWTGTLIWSPVTPVVFYFLTNRKWGTILSIAVFLLILLRFYLHINYEDLPVSTIPHELFVQSLMAYLLAAFLTYYFEKDWSLTKSKLLDLTEIDFLTDILNRRGLEKKLQEFTEIASRYNEKLAVIQFDLDNFKGINDTYGHEKGDQVLKELGNFIKKRIRKTDIFGRLGGEEFVILLRHSSVSTAKSHAEKIRKEIFKNTFGDIRITASFGVTEYSKGETVEKLLARADRAMYRAKIKKNSVSEIKS